MVTNHLHTGPLQEVGLTVKVLVLFDLARRVDAGEQFSPTELRKEEDKPTEADVLAALKRLGPRSGDSRRIRRRRGHHRNHQAICAGGGFSILPNPSMTIAPMKPNIPALLELLKIRYTGRQNRMG